ncbi:hypothetical protein [Priestia megaterium]|uniref:Uncharacterized protein n=1 Tax=Priestia megaterium TaxID=1404 RepID=A0A6M6E060_PRIMG|nr:hypothetical protein [Priestia megaterium]QJX80491.1 hypothetical protein FDZ14_30860 [Priestia megaterium]
MKFLEYLPLLIIVAVTLLYVLIPKSTKPLYKKIFSIYFVAIAVIFIIGREYIAYKYNGTPVPDSFWNLNTGWTNIITIAYLVPAAIFFLVIYIRTIRFTKEIILKWFIGFSIIPISLGFMVALFIFGFGYGYRP